MCKSATSLERLTLIWAYATRHVCMMLRVSAYVMKHGIDDASVHDHDHDTKYFLAEFTSGTCSATYHKLNSKE